MKKLLFTLPLILFSSYLSATDYFLHANNPIGTSWGDKTTWFNDPTAGTNMGSDTFGGNHFFLNGYDLRTGNSASPSSFNGSSLNIIASSERLDLMAGTVNINQTLNVSGGGVALVHATRSVVTLNVTTMNSSSLFSFRAANSVDSLDVVIGTLTGNGDIYFGNRSTTGVDEGSYSISVTNASGFSGRFLPDDGELTIASADFSAATLFLDTVDPNKAGTVDIATSASFAAIEGSSLSVPVGIYDAAALNTLFASTRFTGSGSLTVLGIPPKQFYLHANMPAGTSWIDKASWFDDPIAGSNMGSETFGGNHFFLNGFDLRTGASAGESNFNGSSLNIIASSERLDLMAGTTNILDTLNVSGGGGILVHSTRDAVTLNVETMNSSDIFALRAIDIGQSLALVVNTLAGDGDLIFGNRAIGIVEEGSHSISVTDTSGFTGRLVPDDGVLTIASADFTGATLFLDTVEASKAATVNIGTSAYFAAIEGSSLSVSVGTYDAAALNALFPTDRFTGSGTLSVGIPVPAAPPVITNAVINGSNQYVIDFTGAPLTDYEVKKSLDLGTFGALTAPLVETTDAGGVGQATVPSSEMGGAKQFFLLEEVAP